MALAKETFTLSNFVAKTAVNVCYMEAILCVLKRTRKLMEVQ
jgi:hypothetical protein